VLRTACRWDWIWRSCVLSMAGQLRHSWQAPNPTQRTIGSSYGAELHNLTELCTMADHSFESGQPRFVDLDRHLSTFAVRFRLGSRASSFASD